MYTTSYQKSWIFLYINYILINYRLTNRQNDHFRFKISSQMSKCYISTSSLCDFSLADPANLSSPPLHWRPLQDCFQWPPFCNIIALLSILILHDISSLFNWYSKKKNVSSLYFQNTAFFFSSFNAPSILLTSFQ